MIKKQPYKITNKFVKTNFGKERVYVRNGRYYYIVGNKIYPILKKQLLRR